MVTGIYNIVLKKPFRALDEIYNNGKVIKLFLVYKG
jgi:hypothetical protein